MAPLVVLLAVTGVVRLIGLLTGLPGIDSWSAVTSDGLAAMFLLTASGLLLPPTRQLAAV